MIPLNAISRSRRESIFTPSGVASLSRVHQSRSYGRFRVRAVDCDRLDIHELADAVFPQLATVAASLDAAEGKSCVGEDDRIYEDHAGLDARRHLLATLEVVGPDRRAEAKVAVIRHRDRLVRVGNAHD